MNIATKRAFFQPSPTLEHVNFMLKGAEQLKRGRTLHDLIIRYSMQNDLLWHLDFADYKSVIVMARRLLRQADPRLGTPAGKYNYLLGKQVYPSAKDANAQWRDGIAGKANKEAEVTGLKNPVIIELIELAKAADEPEFAVSDTVAIWAKMPKRERGITLDKQTRSYIRHIEDLSKLEEAQHKLGDAMDRIGALETQMQQLLDKPTDDLDILAERVMQRMSAARNAPAATEAEATV